MSRRSLPIALALLLGSTACTWAEGNPYVLVASEPSGASILVDGDDSGLTTPARLELGGFFGSSHEITVRKAGYQPETRAVYHYSSYSSSRWIDGSAAPEVWTFPLFWTPGDFLFPFASSWSYVPAELYIKLYKDGEPRPGGTAPASTP